jgi:hypothetical protein
MPEMSFVCDRLDPGTITVIQGVGFLDLEDYDMQTLPRYLQDIKPGHLLLDCSLWLLTSIAAGKHGPEWDKFSHVQQVKAYADDEGIPRNCMHISDGLEVHIYSSCFNHVSWLWR